jgi:E3 ubiquitin-protein ligase HUWE1
MNVNDIFCIHFLQVFKGQQNVVNNIVKCLLKRGLVTDLARITHSLDLSSPYMSSTINAALKPLETLSRSVNQPIQNALAKVKAKGDTDAAQGVVSEATFDNSQIGKYMFLGEQSVR